MRKRKGFTLAELLIVVAIIGVLVAIAIPVFTSSLEKARAATCLANQTSAQHAITYEKLIGTKVESEEAGLAIIAATVGELEKLCSSGRIYGYNPTSGVVSCPIHGANSVSLINREPEKIMELDTVKGYFYNENGTRKSNRVQLDSTGPNFGPDVRKEIQKALGLTDDDFDFRVSWPDKSSTMNIYVFNKIDSKDENQTKNIIAYELQQNAHKKWEIAKTGQGKGTVQNASVDGKSYPQIKVDDKAIKWDK
ncbi:prepilin-type N-terminal cleavage/methylation domain-containing protein [Butyricicoccus faecihominis]|uniref:type IV pilin protein n=1 Tax=Butyricicoccus faecihominis TaxID=1712515 RepID=UPI002478CA8D|nr:prepilin-type N-terminal cleavage/methylation domain-containing protein [Butyricicoccus faecihominis]MCQ5129547.1 prepilin-type N-terminal cleavage/methylation domain-containing protein [Butyricicoccus faecihominis]